STARHHKLRTCCDELRALPRALLLFARDETAAPLLRAVGCAQEETMMTAINEKIKKTKVLKEKLQKQAATSLFQPLLTTSDLEQLLKVKRETVRNLVKRGELPMPIKLGGSNRWRPEEISAAIDRLSRRVCRKIEPLGEEERNLC